MAEQVLKAPAGLKTLAEVEYLEKNTICSLAAVVVDYLEPTPTRGTDYSMMFGLLDPSFYSSFNKTVGFKVRYFAARDKLPKISGLGDVVLLRDIKRSEFGFAPILLSSYPTECLVFSAASLTGKASLTATAKTPSNATEAKAAEQAYVRQLRKWAIEALGLSTSGYVPPQPVRSTQNRDKFSLLKDAQDHTFCDIMGEVVKIHAGGVATVYVTDYTSNDLFYDVEKVDMAGKQGRDGDANGYLDDFKTGWEGPPGKVSIQLSLWHPHSSYVNHTLKPKDIVFVRNVHMKISNVTGCLEGKVHEDKKRPDEVAIRKLTYQNDKRYSDFLLRREEFWKAQRRPDAKSEALLKKVEKKRKRQAEKKAKRQAENGDPAAKRLDTGAGKLDGGDTATNSHVACTNLEHSVTQISLLLSEAHRKHKTPAGNNITLPFVNRKCKIRTRVVDFYPPNLEDFTHCLDDPDYNNAEPVATQQSGDSTMVTQIELSDSSQSQRRWEWSFYLLLADASRPFRPADQEPERLRVLVSQQDADYLLKMDAVDLRKDKRALVQLREKLFILWGDLEELKGYTDADAPKPSSQPFDCWVKEYGIPTEDGERWERMFKLSQTTIK